ncbi:MAG: VanZ family protein [Chloroflexi bacterium]|nr:VanZ family protein [Chloroflexota bacterium]MBU1747654.1 VanZ family protein [Chloroflexota bacterium]
MQTRVRLVRWGLVLAWMVGIFALSAQPTLIHPAEPIADVILKKLGHMTEYGVLALLVWWALQPAAPSVRWPALAWPFVIAVLYAASDEWHQTGVPGRNGNALDWTVDLAGAGLALVGLRVAWLRATGLRRSRSR